LTIKPALMMLFHMSMRSLIHLELSLIQLSIIINAIKNIL
jgi:hypothetical protein